jgi:outer membrane immunogenic protein
LAAVWLGALPAGATAADYNWTGLYIGANAGYASGHSTAQQGLTAPNCDGPICPDLIALVARSAQDLDPRGFTGGLQFGYNHRHSGSNLVFGFEADVNFVRLNQSFSLGPIVVNPAFPIDFDARGAATADWFGTVRGRVGVPFDRLLVYATGGFAVTNATYWEVATTSTNRVNALRTFRLSNSLQPGWAAGGGFEYALGNRWSAKAEYLHFDFGATTDTTPATGGIGGMRNSVMTLSARLSVDVVRVGLNFRLD